MLRTRNPLNLRQRGNGQRLQLAPKARRRRHLLMYPLRCDKVLALAFVAQVLLGVAPRKVIYTPEQRRKPRQKIGASFPLFSHVFWRVGAMGVLAQALVAQAPARRREVLFPAVIPNRQRTISRWLRRYTSRQNRRWLRRYTPRQNRRWLRRYIWGN